MKSVISWDDYFMSIAEVVATRSKDPKTQVGAVIVDENKHIIATGFNGFPSGLEETEERWNTEQKYEFVVHAEMNCILHAIKSVKNCTIYTTMYPCSNCAKNIANAGIKKIIYLDDKYHNQISDTIFKECCIDIKKHIRY